jgi:hypothetical protein
MYAMSVARAVLDDVGLRGRQVVATGPVAARRDAEREKSQDDVGDEACQPPFVSSTRNSIMSIMLREKRHG